MNRSRVLLVLAVLAGVLAMHGLAMSGPAPSMAASGHHAASENLHTRIVSPSAVRVTCPDDGAMPEHGVGHADRTCASGAVPGAPALPALAAAPESGAPVAAHLARAVTPGAIAERAPPALSELQLLRI